MALDRIPHAIFIRDYVRIERGQHMLLIGPNGVGKTTIGMLLLAEATRQQPLTRGVALAMKPHRGPRRGSSGPGGRLVWRVRGTGDETVARLTRQLGGRIVRRWPPLPGARPAFWTLWPRHTFDIDIDETAHYEAFRHAINHEYQHGNSFIFADELYSLSKELKLDREIVRVLTKGRSMGVGLIGATQRAAWVPTWAYSESKHFYLWNVRDGGAYDRLREIGNVDPKWAVATLRRLSKHECLYLYPDAHLAAILT